METLEALHQESLQLLQQFQRLNDAKINRTEAVEQIQAQIEKREVLLVQMKGPYSEEEMKLGKEILELNEKINQQMNLLYEEIKTDIKQIQGRKKQNYSYINPYNKVNTADGLYMDHKS